MRAWLGSVLIALVGMLVLAVAQYAPRGDSRLVAALVPPWQAGGILRAAGTGLAVVDLHWAGHVIVLDTGGDPAALARLRASGLWLIDAAGAAICGGGAA